MAAVAEPNTPNDAAGLVRRYLAPLQPYLDAPGTSEVSVNAPGRLYHECNGAITAYDEPELTLNQLQGLAKLIATYNKQTLDESRPLLGGTLPDGERVQVILPPAVENGVVVLAIRKPSVLERSIADYADEGAFEDVAIDNSGRNALQDELNGYLASGDYQRFLERAVATRHNIIVSGGTSTGKTTFTNALIKSIPSDERLITIEDAREVTVPADNVVHLLYSHGDQGLAQVRPSDLINASLRLRPDRILLSELRSTEALDFLEAVSTGHPGSMTTVHADSPRHAIDRIAREILKAGTNMTREEIATDVRSVIDIIVQLQRRGGRRVVSEIHYDPSY